MSRTPADLPRTIALSLVAPSVAALALIAVTSGPARAVDARSLGVGGSVIANGEGAPGAWANPAALMAMQRRGEKVHFNYGVGIELRDDAGIIDIADDELNESLEDDIDRALDELDGATLECDPRAPGSPDEICFRGLESLADLSARALNILDSIDGEDFNLQGTSHLGLAITGTPVPFSLHLAARVTARGELDATPSDREYFESFATALGGVDAARGQLTRGEIDATAALDYDAETQTLDVDEPEDVLASDVAGGSLLRVTFGASFARTVDIKGLAVDFGVTPRLSSIIAAGVMTTLAEEFDDTDESSEDRFEDSEVRDTTFTFDVGGSMLLNRYPVRLAAVIRNVVPESTRTREGFVFETTPQLIVGGLVQRGPVAFNADLALNEAQVDSFDTQVLALGSEFVAGPFALRAGINHDFARSNAATALSLGFGLGPVEFGARMSAIEHVQAGFQIAVSF